MVIKGTITKLSRNNNALRTTSMEGTFRSPPMIGRPFAMFGAPLSPGGFARVIWTSPVKSIVEEKNGWKITTENSKYRVTKGESTDG